MWKPMIFVKYTNPDPISKQLSDFLNEEKIEQFIVVQMQDGVLEIIYKEYV